MFFHAFFRQQRSLKLNCDVHTTLCNTHSSGHSQINIYVNLCEHAVGPPRAKLWHLCVVTQRLQPFLGSADSFPKKVEAAAPGELE